MFLIGWVRVTCSCLASRSGIGLAQSTQQFSGYVAFLTLCQPGLSASCWTVVSLFPTWCLGAPDPQNSHKDLLSISSTILPQRGTLSRTLDRSISSGPLTRLCSSHA